MATDVARNPVLAVAAVGISPIEWGRFRTDRFEAVAV
jgi:hypothetical protein